MFQQHEDSNIDAFARELAALTPRPVEFDRDRLMYEAGRTAALASPARLSQRRRVWPWQMATALLLVISLGLACAALSLSDAMQQQELASAKAAAHETIARRPSAQAVLAASPPHMTLATRQLATAYLRLRATALCGGIYEMETFAPPANDSSPASPPLSVGSARSLLDGR